MNTDNRSDIGRKNRLYKNPRRGLIFGVCAGIAEYAGFDLTVTRVVVVIGAMTFSPIFLVAYLLLAFMLPRKPYEGPESEGSLDPVQRQVRANPHDMLSSVRYRFRDLDARLQRLEKYVTSNRFSLDQEFRRLQD